MFRNQRFLIVLKLKAHQEMIILTSTTQEKQLESA